MEVAGGLETSRSLEIPGALCPLFVLKSSPDAWAAMVRRPWGIVVAAGKIWFWVKRCSMEQ